MPSNQRDLFPPIHHSTDTFQTIMVGSKHMKSKTPATTQSATGPSQHDYTTLNQLLYFGIEAGTPHPATVAAIAAPPFGPVVESAAPSHYTTPPCGLRSEPICSFTDPQLDLMLTTMTASRFILKPSRPPWHRCQLWPDIGATTYVLSFATTLDICSSQAHL